jgi:pilus assembly protein Flp/PilA
MKNAIAKVIRFARDEDGITAIEYALLASLIALAIITAVTGVGTALKTAFDNIATSV